MDRFNDGVRGGRQESVDLVRPLWEAPLGR
jgi:hypothetical protein